MDAVDYLPLVFFALGMLADRLVSARAYTKVPWWLVKGLCFFLAGGAVAIGFDEAAHELAHGRHLVDGSGLPLPVGILVGLLTLTFFTYWTHRAFHRFHWLWRWTHQMHHAPERIDTLTSFFTHPFEIIIQGLTLAVVLRLMLGLSTEAVAIASATAFFFTVFQHANVRTPHWVGYVVQRPESHNLHHQRGVHAWNYSDLAIWDMVFGTFKNPRNFVEVQTGFYDLASRRIGHMLIGKDVSAPDAPHPEQVAALSAPLPSRSA